MKIFIQCLFDVLFFLGNAHLFAKFLDKYIKEKHKNDDGWKYLYVAFMTLFSALCILF